MPASATPPLPAVDPSWLCTALRPPGGPPLDLRETHRSWVFLTATHAYKLRKPLRFDTVDLRSVEARRSACEEEVQANRLLAGTLGLHVVDLVVGPGGCVLGAPGTGEPMVVSRRFDESDTLAARIAAGRAGPADVVRVGALLARFHAGARRMGGPLRTPEVAAANLDGLAGAVAGRLPDARLAALRHFTSAFLEGWADVLAGRAATGRVVDGHGDLRAGHVLLEGDDVVVVGRLDLPELRVVDIADDLASLCMDLEACGAPELVRPLLRGYVDAGGERPPSELVAFFSCHRAAVRAKFALVRAGQPGAGPAPVAEAAGLLGLAERCAARARGENVLVVGGPPASGKSTLAQELSRLTGLPVLRSDEVRPDVAGGYDPAARTAVYAELGRRARELPACIVDATFGEPGPRRAFLAELDRDHRRHVFAVEVRARPATLERRARERVHGERFGSEADAAVAARLASRFTPFDELEPGDRLAVDGEDPPAQLADVVLRWLDRQLAAGRLG